MTSKYMAVDVFLMHRSRERCDGDETRIQPKRKCFRSVRTESDFTLSVLCAHLCYNHARRPSASPMCPQIYFIHIYISLQCTKNNLNKKYLKQQSNGIIDTKKCHAGVAN